MFALCSCSLDEPLQKSGSEADRINLGGEIEQAYLTRADDSGFADKDEIGIYVVDYADGQPGALKNSGNRADNVRHTFDEASWKWIPARSIYWKDKETHIDVYGYYPYGENINNVENYAFYVSGDQRSTPKDGDPGGYEASDFLLGKVADVAPTDRLIRISFSHRMAGMKITLAEGDGFADGEWTAAAKDVMIVGTKRQAAVNLSTGEVRAIEGMESGNIIPLVNGDEFRAVAAPQEIAAGTYLFSITVNGISYRFSKDEIIHLSAGRQHNFTITVGKRPDGDFEFKLSGESISDWENDPASHDGTAKEYIMVNVGTAGTLDECLKDAGRDIAKVRNLKLTGTVNARDFAVMKHLMTSLSSLNLKEVQIEKLANSDYLDDSGQHYYNSNKDNQIPPDALSGKKSLLHLILPDSITEIGPYAFRGCENISGSLIIPEGATRIEGEAFSMCKSLNSLSLPSSLLYIEDSAFHNCGFTCELVLPKDLEYIGESAFASCNGLYGNLYLPKGLTHLGAYAFAYASGLSGSITIPEGITAIESSVFSGCSSLNGTLTLPQSLTSIGELAFAYTGLRGELILPKTVHTIGPAAFNSCRFNGRLILPEALQTIGDGAFAANSRLSGTLVIPEDVVNIGSEAFEYSGIEAVVFPKNLESIKANAFFECFNINRIVCKGEIPPYVQSRAFEGISKENFTLEVPESAVAQYQAAPGWNEFRRISAYRNLSVSPASACALNAKTSRELVLHTDEEWFVESKPDWININPSNGSGKSVITMEFSQKPPGNARDGEIIFKLKDKDYRTVCTVSQYDFEYAEDEILTLQASTEGNGINIVFLGDGYSARDISEGELLNDVEEAVGHFFSIEPYKSYKDWFNVYTGIAVSPESGVGGVNTTICNRFNTIAEGGGRLGGRYGESDAIEILRYALKAPTVNESNLAQTLIVMIPNTSEYGGTTYLYEDGTAISYCPKSSDSYPLDFRGIIQHEAGGHGFGKLGDENIYHNAFIDQCCGAYYDFLTAKSRGWYDNLSLTGKMKEVPWAHLLFHDKYKQIVDIYEGGYMHSRGIFRSELNSCMNNSIPYYSTISRESIVRRIKSYIGEEFSFEDFVERDNIEGRPQPSGAREETEGYPPTTHQNAPVFMGRRPSVK